MLPALNGLLMACVLDGNTHEIWEVRSALGGWC